MRVAVTAPLFAWDALEDSPSLRTIRTVLATLPDGRLLESLQVHRGRGRDDYPVHVLWAVVVLKVALRHVTIQATLDELRRNRDLRRLIGIESESKVPSKWNVSRFLGVLGAEPHRSVLREVFDAMIRRLSSTVKDLGRRTAGDATHLSARPDGGDDTDLPAPAGGRKEYYDADGTVTDVIEWFGYKLHVLVDVRHEVALGYRVSSTQRGDNEELAGLVDQAQANLPAGRMESLAYDKAADDGKVHAYLKRRRIAPVIEIRSQWTDQAERLLPGHDGRSGIVYDETGTIWCYDLVSDPPVRRAMSYIGHEAARETLKYRCPARHQGFACPSDGRCNAGKKYGRTIRVKQQIDLRRFPPVPRGTKTFERLYKGRSAVERVNARLKVFWGADDGNIVGAQRFHAMVGTVMAVHAAFATVLAMTPRAGGTLGKMRLTPIAKALQEKVHP